MCKWWSHVAESVQGGARQASTTPSGEPAFLAQPRAPAKNKQVAPGKALLGSGASLGKLEPQQAGRRNAAELAGLIDGASSKVILLIRCLWRQLLLWCFSRVLIPFETNDPAVLDNLSKLPHSCWHCCL